MSYSWHLLNGFTYAGFSQLFRHFSLSYFDDVSFCARVGMAFGG
jgi:hypothetical protein